MTDDQILNNRDDENMIISPHLWPISSVLPLKHRYQRDEKGWAKLGFVLRVNPLYVYVGCLDVYFSGGDISQLPAERFRSAKEMVEKGWVVD